jgi:endogenous inhibitor of DNA gyrase (YacG/DUF329 family)
MPLVPCPDCGAQISSEAWSCPTCGRPSRGKGRGTRFAFMFIAMLVVVMAIQLFGAWRQR